MLWDCNNPCWRLQLIGSVMDFVRCVLLWEQRWVRWSGRQEIRWRRPPCRSPSPRLPSDAAAPLLSTCGLPSRNLPLSSRVETYTRTQSGPTVKFIVTVWLWKIRDATFWPWGRNCVVSPNTTLPAGQGPALAPVSHLDELPLPVAWGWGNHRHWRRGNTDNMQF